MVKYLARISRSKGFQLIAETYEVPSLSMRRFELDFGLVMFDDWCYTVWEQESQLVIVLCRTSVITHIFGVNCSTGARVTYFEGQVKCDFSNKNPISLPFVQFDTLCIPAVGRVFRFELLTGSVNSYPISGEYNVCPLLTPGSMVIRNIKKKTAAVVKEHQTNKLLPYAYQELRQETMIPVGDSQVLIMGGQLQLGVVSRVASWGRYCKSSSIILWDLNSGSSDVIGDFPYVPGSIVGWAVEGECVYALWNTVKITRTNLATRTMKVVFDQHFFNSVKPFLYWMKLSRLRLTRSHMKFIMSMMVPPDVEETYANVVRAKEFI
jgi:hypothetical protein